MSKNYYLPRTDEDKATWLNNFALKLPIYANKYNITSAEMQDMQSSAQYFDALLDCNNQFKAYVSSVTAFKNLLRDGAKNGAISELPMPPAAMLPPAVAPGIFARSSAIANRIKASLNYSTADGDDLGIEGTQSTVNLNTMKPQLQGRLVAGGHPEIGWKKQGMDGVEIQKMDENGNWQHLAVDLKPNYIDNSPLPPAGSSAVWRYRAIYLYKDERVGQWSDVLVVTVTG